MKPDLAPEVAVLVGRFQPFHRGHLGLLENALQLAARALVVVGSAGGPRLAKNPFTETERIDMIRQSLTPAQRDRVSFLTLRDYYDEPRWACVLKARVEREHPGKVTLVGFRKDESSSYLSAFPEWSERALPRQAPIDGTALRRLYFAGTDADLPDELEAAVPTAVAQFLRSFRATSEFQRLREELQALEESRRAHGTGPFVTVDALVTVGPKLLLVQRARAPGKGLWALPGGFLDGSERLLDAALRELREETRINFADDELRASFRSAVVFDHPQRSQRGRTITHVHYFALPGSSALPGVVGADDALHARWFDSAQLTGMTSELFEDHFQIIDHFLAIARD